MGLMLSYLDFFDLIAIDTMSAPPTIPHVSIITSSTTNEEALDIIRQKVNERRQDYIQKASTLRVRIEKDKADVKTLIAEYDAGTSPSQSALKKRIVSTRGLLDSVINNFNAAMNDHAGSMYLTDVAMSQHMVVEIERRLRVVEVALRGGIEGETKESESDVDEINEERGRDNLAEDRLFRVYDDAMERIEYEQDDIFFRWEDAGESQQKMPPIGLFRV